MEFKTLIYEKEEGLGIITLNRRKTMNALNSELMEELDRLLDVIRDDDEIGAVIITGRRNFFGVGADIGEVVSISTPVEARRLADKAQALFKKLEGLRQPVIAAVSGLALGGGCEMCLACDTRIAAKNARFGTPEIKLGLLPGAGGTQRLPRLVGLGRAKEILYSGDPIDADEAWRIGLVNKVVPIESLLDEAKAMAKKFLKQPAFALATIKNLVNTGIKMDLDSALTHESRCFELLFATEDQKEGVRAFLEKRKPVFKGR